MELPLKARAVLNREQAATFALDHGTQTARHLETFSDRWTLNEPFLGVQAEVKADGLHLMGYPFNGQVVYPIVEQA